MYKLIFEFLTEPLELPVQWYWEYIILGIIGIIAFKVAWYVSPGGTFGSEIHWGTRIFVFVVLWAIVKGIITGVRWLITNWILAIIIFVVFILLIACISFIFIKRKFIKEK